MVELVDLVKEALKQCDKDRRKKRRRSDLDEKKDPVLAILDYCHENISGYESAWFYLSAELSEKNPVRKIAALLVMDSLFHNSHHFRRVVNEGIDLLLQHTGILDTSGRSSSSRGGSETNVFRKGIELIALWDFLYGTELGKVHVMARYIKENLNIQLPNVSLQLEELRRQRQEREQAHQQRTYLIAQQIRQLDLPGLLTSCSETMDAIDQCFDILFPNPLQKADNNGENEAENKAEDEDNEDIRWEVDETAEAAVGGDSFAAAMRSAAPFTLELNIATTASDLKNDDNEILLSCIEEGAAQLAKSLIPRLVGLQKDLMAARGCYQKELAGLDPNMNSSNLSRLQEKLLGKLQVEDKALNDIQTCLGRAKELLTNRCKSLLTKE